MDRLAERFASEQFDAVVGIESRGFVFAAPLAYRLGVPLTPVRKQGKLPFDTHSVTYALEYGSDSLEVHVDAIGEGSRALIVDDLLATGGTAAATVRLVERSGASVAGLAFVIELTDLGGRNALSGYRVESLVDVVAVVRRSRGCRQARNTKLEVNWKSTAFIVHNSPGYA